MDITRREFAAALTGVAGAATLRRNALHPAATDPCHHLPAPIQALTPKTDGITPITDEERRARIAKAQGLMAARGIGAIVIEPERPCTTTRRWTGTRRSGRLRW
jgi:Xaa-Pro dipeptidase